ncbi:MAG: hypothetical protein ABSE93_02850 [Terriglobia bacterium]|jgi:putative transposase
MRFLLLGWVLMPGHFHVYSEKKRREKLDYMHNNPVKRGLVSSPGDWPWSSWGFYFLQDASILRMDRLE